MKEYLCRAVIIKEYNLSRVKEKVKYVINPQSYFYLVKLTNHGFTRILDHMIKTLLFYLTLSFFYSLIYGNYKGLSRQNIITLYDECIDHGRS